MTREEAMKELSYIIDDMPSMECAEWIEAISMGIKSLEAWEKVRQEIISERNHRRDRGHHEQSIGLSKAIEIIDKHL